MNDIFKYFISHNDADDVQRFAYASWFTDAFPVEEFVSDEQFFWMFTNYCVTLGVPLKFKYLETWCFTELRTALRNLKARVPGCETLNYDDPLSFETAYTTTAKVLYDDFNILETDVPDITEFKADAAKFMSIKRKERLTEALSNTYNVLNESDDCIKATDYALQTIQTINELYDEDVLLDLEADEYYADDETEEIKRKHSMKLISTCGLPAIDKDSDGIYGSQLFGIEAQPGTGKTRFALGTYVYRALTIHKTNVLFLALEQKPMEIEAMLVALHVFNLFNIQISDRMIWTNKVPEEFQQQVEAARYDLFKSGKYGKCKYMEVDLYVETFISKITNWDRLHGPFDLIVIDYMGLIESMPAQFKKELTEAEIIKKSFKAFKKYLRRTNKAGIAVSQFNREGVQAGKADKEITTDMAQGGMAVYRNTDYNIAISMTETMRLAQKRRFSQPKVRASGGFGSFVADTRLGFCYWRQVVQKAV